MLQIIELFNVRTFGDDYDALKPFNYDKDMVSISTSISFVDATASCIQKRPDTDRLPLVFAYRNMYGMVVKYLA